MHSCIDDDFIRINYLPHLGESTCIVNTPPRHFNPIIICNCIDNLFRYQLGQPLGFAPGTSYTYSNFGYCVLGRVIERVTGKTYEAAVEELVLIPTLQGPEQGGSQPPEYAYAPSEMYIGNTLVENIPRHESEYACRGGDDAANLNCKVAGLPESAYSVIQGASTSPFVPYPYGRWSVKTMDAHGGWVASPRAILNVIRSVFPPHCGGSTAGVNSHQCLLSTSSLAELKASDANVDGSSPSSWYGLGFRVNQYGNLWHTGSLSGTTSIVVVANNGFSWAVAFNSRGWSGNYDGMMWDAVTCVGAANWPSSFLPSTVVAAEPSPAEPGGENISYTRWTPSTVDTQRWGLLGALCVAIVITTTVLFCTVFFGGCKIDLFLQTLQIPVTTDLSSYHHAACCM